MRKVSLWLGGVLLVVGIAVVGASAVLAYLGFSPSYNLGDPAKFQFVLVPFWQIGLGFAVLGAICVWIGRLLKAV